ncbi:MAG: Mur ligase family protein [Deinococcales bacterium]
MHALMRALELTPPPHAVHVVGTNGKGTVTAMLDAGLRAAGARCGRFVSPHVEDFRERIMLDGEPVSRDTVRRFVAMAQSLSEPRRRRLGWGVFEAGVGGARDATRAVDPVALVVLTNVSLDHVQTLGADVPSSAREKAGAFRPGVPVVTGAEGEALSVLARTAARLGCPLHVDAPGDPLFEPPRAAAADAAPGRARARNARLAAAALRLLGLPEAAVARGLAAPPLPARGERFRIGGHDVVLDGAHDPAAAALLASALPPGYVLVFGALRRKLGAATLAALEPGAGRIIVTEAVAGEPTLRDPAGRAVIGDPVAAVRLALGQASAGQPVVIAGSLYLAGRVRPWLRRMARTTAQTTTAELRPARP